MRSKRNYCRISSGWQALRRAESLRSVAKQWINIAAFLAKLLKLGEALKKYFLPIACLNPRTDRLTSSLNLSAILPPEWQLLFFACPTKKQLYQNMYALAPFAPHFYTPGRRKY